MIRVSRRSPLWAAGMVASFAAASTASAQTPAVIGKDTTTVEASARYDAGSLHRSLFGDNYRDEWKTPIKVPVLDLAHFAGGLTPWKLGGGRQTKSLRLLAPDSVEYVFRPVYKAQTILPHQFRHTIIWDMFMDQGSASHPAGTTAAAPILEAVGVLHPTPRLAVMPDDFRLGEFRKEFANVLGSIEEYPVAPKQGRAFAGASHIIDAGELLEKINKHPSNRVNAKQLLRARLVDMLLNDNDRHPGQWKWARLSSDSNALWEPIPRDRDKVFLSYEGFLIDLARKAAPSLVKFDSVIPKGKSLFENAGEFDRRMLGSLDKNTWTSEAIALKQKITDEVIDRSVRAMPREYTRHSAEIVAKLRSRRDLLPAAAAEYYDELWPVAEVHGTDASDTVLVDRSPDGSVTVQLRSGTAEPYFARRFEPSETGEIRVYLHDGDDAAAVTGDSPNAIPVKIVGGKGNNFIGMTGKERNRIAFYDVGNVSNVRYAPDTTLERKDPASALDQSYNRRPWVRAYGTELPPQEDRGVRMKPVVGARTGHGIGLTPKIGISRTVYGFRYVPYENRLQADVAYSVVHRGFAVNLFADKRLESSDVHLPAEAAVTQLDIVQFRGFGNAIPEREGRLYDVRQTAWRVRPAIGLSLNPESDISLGPVIRYTSTDSTANRFISQVRPYGFTRFKQAGAQLKLHFDSRPKPDTTRLRVVVDGGASGYPGLWDAKTAYESIDGAVTAYINIPIGTRPVIALHGGGKKLYGNFPYFDAAFLGGGSTLRTEHRQRYAGDASLYGSGELRVPIAKFPLILPLDVGLLGFTEMGRVYLDGESQGGWHKAAGGGFWLGVVDPGLSVNVLITNQPDRRTMVSLGFAY